jgi:hypothetical protein
VKTNSESEKVNTMTDDTLQRIKELLDGAPAPEMVTMTKAEADALRAGAAPAIPSADVSQVPAQVQAAADRLEASGGIQASMVTEADLRTMTAQQIAKLPPEAVNQALEGGRS